MKEVRIAELADAQGAIHDQVFEDSEIIGPAVLVAVGNETQFSDCQFPAPPEAFVWELPTGARKYGAVFLVRCTFRRCRFQATTGLAVDPERTEAMRAPLN